jgi:hypothetical protein
MRESTPGARGGLVIVAFGVGLAFFLHAMAPEKGAWTIGAIPVLVGAVVTAFGIFTKQESGDERSG